jgi:uncharacterized membrane protein YtjA (UPF0391 family)
MLQWAVIFLVIALIAAAMGYGGVSAIAVDGAKLFVWVFLVLFVLSLVAGLVRRSR